MPKLNIKNQIIIAGTIFISIAGFTHSLKAADSNPISYDDWTAKYWGGNCDQQVCGQNADPDNDGLTNIEEYQAGTDPTNADTDGDGLADGDEVHIFGSDPTKASTMNNDKYNDGNYMAGGYALVPGKEKMSADDIASIAQKINQYGLHQPTPKTLRYSLSEIYNLDLTKKITVSLSGQSLTAYVGDYAVANFLISSGTKTGPTPPGDYKVLVKRPVVDYKGTNYDYPNTKWNLMFKQQAKGNLYVHGAYWHHNFGHPMSHGCINVSYANMQPLYNWADVGTEVVIE